MLLPSGTADSEARIKTNNKLLSVYTNYKNERSFLMPYKDNFSAEMNNYFNSLPKYIQENIVQSGAKINSLEELKNIVSKIQNQD